MFCFYYLRFFSCIFVHFYSHVTYFDLVYHFNCDSISLVFNVVYHIAPTFSLHLMYGNIILDYFFNLPTYYFTIYYSCYSIIPKQDY